MIAQYKKIAEKFLCEAIMGNELKIEESSIEVKFIISIVFLTVYAIIIGFFPFFLAR
jgi:hypothetical protein